MADRRAAVAPGADRAPEDTNARRAPSKQREESGRGRCSEQAAGAVGVAVAGASAAPQEVVLEQDAAFGGPPSRCEQLSCRPCWQDLVGALSGISMMTFLPLSSSGQVIQLRPSRLVTRPRGLRCSRGWAVDPTHCSQHSVYSAIGMHQSVRAVCCVVRKGERPGPCDGPGRVQSESVSG